MAGAAASASTLFCDEMMEKDSAESTKRGYKGLTNHFIQFLKHHNPAGVSDDGSVDLAAVALEDVKAFLSV